FKLTVNRSAMKRLIFLTQKTKGANYCYCLALPTTTLSGATIPYPDVIFYLSSYWILLILKFRCGAMEFSENDNERHFYPYSFTESYLVFLNNLCLSIG
ncbi:hypothetical protein VU01_10974, partial [Candidatus Electrothrix marina]